MDDVKTIIQKNIMHFVFEVLNNSDNSKLNEKIIEGVLPKLMKLYFSEKKFI